MIKRFLSLFENCGFWQLITIFFFRESLRYEIFLSQILGMNSHDLYLENIQIPISLWPSIVAEICNRGTWEAGRQQDHKFKASLTM